MAFRKKIITVNSPKGGVGKTSFVKQLAYQLSNYKFDNGDLKVLVVDLDLEFGDVCSLFQINPISNIVNWIAEIEYKLKNNETNILYPEMAFKQKYVTSIPNSNIDILPAPIKHIKYNDINFQAIDIILNNIKTYNYDIVIIDTGNNTFDYTIRSILLSDIVFCITTSDITTIKRIQSLKKFLKNINIDTSKFIHILNFYTSQNDENLIQVEEYLNKINFILPFDDTIRVNNNNSGSFLSKKTSYYQEVENVVNYILNI